MNFSIEGKLHKKFEAKAVTESFTTRELVIETDSQYPQLVKFQLTQDNCPLLDHHKEGDTILVHFDLRGRQWNDKFFTNLQAWKIDKVDSTSQELPSNVDNTNDILASMGVDVGDQPATGMDDDLPF